MYISNYEEFTEFIKNNIPSIRQISQKLDKNFWINELKNRSFSENYIITKVPKVLKQYGIHSQCIYMSLENMAYILSRHNQEYSVDSYLKMKETIDDYDLLLYGEHLNMLDFKFYKLFRTITPDMNKKEKYYGIEVVIDKKEEFIDELIVHMNYWGRKKKKALLKYDELIKNDKLIDSK